MFHSYFERKNNISLSLLYFLYIYFILRGYILNFCNWYLLVYYAIFCPTLNKDFNNNNNNNNDDDDNVPAPNFEINISL